MLVRRIMCVTDVFVKLVVVCTILSRYWRKQRLTAIDITYVGNLVWKWEFDG